jgi:hypothetical protein
MNMLSKSVRKKNNKITKTCQRIIEFAHLVYLSLTKIFKFNQCTWVEWKYSMPSQLYTSLAKILKFSQVYPSNQNIQVCPSVLKFSKIYPSLTKIFKFNQVYPSLTKIFKP